MNAATMRGADGTPLHRISQLFDVTPQRAAERALRDRNDIQKPVAFERFVEVERPISLSWLALHQPPSKA